MRRSSSLASMIQINGSRGDLFSGLSGRLRRRASANVPSMASAQVYEEEVSTGSSVEFMASRTVPSHSVCSSIVSEEGSNGGTRKKSESTVTEDGSISLVEDFQEQEVNVSSCFGG